MPNPECLFCEYDNPEFNTVIVEEELVYARWDNFAISAGHAEVVPKRHVESYFELTDEELLAIFGLTKHIKEIIDANYHPDAYNIGVNDGVAAGRTIHHCHVHLIPRYTGDVANPRGGIRHIIPGKGSY
jgi:diadenosine tetraphosphate (Ap4A) HIT family hydrolase